MARMQDFIIQDYIQNLNEPIPNTIQQYLGTPPAENPYIDTASCSFETRVSTAVRREIEYSIAANTLSQQAERQLADLYRQNVSEFQRQRFGQALEAVNSRIDDAINSVVGNSSLFDAIEALSRSIAQQLSSGAKIVDDSDFEIIEINSKEEALRHGKQCGWCTGNPDSPNDHYNNTYRHGRLFVLYRLVDGRKKRRPSYQLFVGDLGEGCPRIEFRKKGNEKVDLDHFIENMGDEVSKKLLSELVGSNAAPHALRSSAVSS